MIKVWHDDNERVQYKEGISISYENGFVRLTGKDGVVHVIPRDKIIRIEEGKHD